VSLEGSVDPELILVAVAIAQSREFEIESREKKPLLWACLRTDVDAVFVSTSVEHESIGSETRGNFLCFGKWMLLKYLSAPC